MGNLPFGKEHLRKLLGNIFVHVDFFGLLDPWENGSDKGALTVCGKTQF